MNDKKPLKKEDIPRWLKNKMNNAAICREYGVTPTQVIRFCKKHGAVLTKDKRATGRKIKHRNTISVLEKNYMFDFRHRFGVSDNILAIAHGSWV